MFSASMPDLGGAGYPHFSLYNLRFGSRGFLLNFSPFMESFGHGSHFGTENKGFGRFFLRYKRVGPAVEDNPNVDNS